jgi:2-polyprenyl-6-methoxyphenol hydroxylase-like FAD-dependent oxidoreductase
MRNLSPSETNVLIVGAGPVGLMLACELRRREINCRIIDKVRDFPQTSRANGLQPRSIEVFDSLGIADRVLARGFPVRGIRLVRGGREIARIETRLARDAHPSTRPDLPYPSAATVNQAIVEGVLREKLSELGGHVECQRELLDYEENPDGLVVQVADVGSAAVERVSAKWLVGCDGAHSIVRKLLQLPLEGKEYPEHWLLADVRLKGELPDAIGILWLNDQGLLAAIPFNEPGLFRLYAVVTPDAQGNVPQTSVELFQRLIAERGGDTTTKLSEPVWLSNFMVHHRMVPHYRKGLMAHFGEALQQQEKKPFS